ncbi:MAG: sialate O-acetylesterase [Spirochaetes bacterium]|nr:sialate O-acetylesterase [Spirochaetota bacterium]
MNQRILTLLAFGMFLCAFPLLPDVKLHGLFTDNAVLQRETDLPVYGTGDEGEQVTVEFNGQKVSGTVKDGKWKVIFKPMKAGGPFTMTVTAKNTIVIKNLLLGDIWLCTGQSNMQTSIKYYKTYENGIFTMFADIPGDFSNDMIRLYKVASRAADEPEEKVTPDRGDWSNWRVCAGTAIEDFSATGYFFGKKLQPEAGVPIGLIFTTIGGTSVSSWVSRATLTSKPEFKPYVDSYEQAVSNFPKANERYTNELKIWKDKQKAGEKVGRMPEPPMGPNHIKRNSGLYNAMIAPLREYTIKGAIWYQGESDSGRPIVYRTFFPAMIEQWRSEWAPGPFYFFFVQLAGYMTVNEKPEDPNWAYLREAQTMTLSLPNTGMALAIDGGLEKNIHPPYKELVGGRLAAVALKSVYGKNIVASGPMFKAVKFDGAKAIVTFDNIGGGLVAKEVTLDTRTLPAGILKGFAVCGEDKKFKWADAEIKSNTVTVTSAEVPNPVAIRYAWANFPLANLYNKEDFPAVPFRSDNFEPGEAGKIGGIAMNKPWKCSHPNAAQNAAGNYGGLTDGIADDNGRNVFSTDSATNFPKNAVIDLKGSFNVSAIRVYNSKLGGTKTVEVLVSSDGENYTAVGQKEFTNYSDEIYDAGTLKLEKVSFVKIVFHDVHDLSFQNKKNGFVFLREVEVQGVPSK